MILNLGRFHIHWRLSCLPLVHKCIRNRRCPLLVFEISQPEDGGRGHRRRRRIRSILAHTHASFGSVQEAVMSLRRGMSRAIEGVSPEVMDHLDHPLINVQGGGSQKKKDQTSADPISRDVTEYSTSTLIDLSIWTPEIQCGAGPLTPYVCMGLISKESESGWGLSPGRSRSPASALFRVLLLEEGVCIIRVQRRAHGASSAGVAVFLFSLSDSGSASLPRDLEDKRTKCVNPMCGWDDAIPSLNASSMDGWTDWPPIPPSLCCSNFISLLEPSTHSLPVENLF